jgi:hypothetical protein
MSATITMPMNTSVNSTRAVADPRRHPRPTSQFTAGSSANERNRAAISQTTRSRRRRNSENAAYAAKAVRTTSSRSRGIHAGIRAASRSRGTRPTPSAPRT